MSESKDVVKQFDDKLIASIKKMSVMVEVTSDYLKMTDGEVKRFVVLATTEFKKEDDTLVDAIRLYDINDKKNVITASAVLVSSCKILLKQAPDDKIIAIEVHCLGQADGKKYTNYKVLLLG